MRFAVAVLMMVLVAPVAQSAPRKKLRVPVACNIADQITTGAIDAAKDALETRLSRVPPAGTIEIAFAPLPQRSAERLVQKVIASAKSYLFIAAYQMTSKPIADSLCQAATRGVAVTAVLDAKSNKHGLGNSKRDYLEQCGVAVRTNARYPIMHDKFIVVDGKHVETGSFNYTFAAAERNAENAMVIWDNPALAAKYMSEFDRLFAEASD
jgi:phosphatidylserine/phosphatidylglycerophosphate/cardiolipin synthase-like enzyme